jgi:hypothetical protein
MPTLKTKQILTAPAKTHLQIAAITGGGGGGRLKKDLNLAAEKEREGFLSEVGRALCNISSQFARLTRPSGRQAGRQSRYRTFCQSVGRSVGRSGR